MIKTPIIDLFAGPGGLGEGFTRAGFEIRLSIEKDPQAHETLLFRAFSHALKASIKGAKSLENYFRAAQEDPIIALKELIKSHPKEHGKAENEAWLAELGGADFPNTKVSDRIDKALDGAKEWILIGGPPCQAYSLAGRSRMKGTNPDFENDHRHFLYKQYLRIVADHSPTVFVMENVKGILSANVKKIDIFKQILADLHEPGKATNISVRNDPSDAVYDLYPVVRPHNDNPRFAPSDFLTRAEDFGIPQKRHRVLIIGIKRGSNVKMEHLDPDLGAQVTVADVINDLPKLRSGFSRPSSYDWCVSIREIEQCEWLSDLEDTDPKLRKVLLHELGKLRKTQNNGLNIAAKTTSAKPKKLRHWYQEHKPPFIFNHVCRNHMDSDLKRYFYAACYTKAHGISPKLSQYPKELLPAHKNVNNNTGKIIFDDRFRVQGSKQPSTTVVSHISKDGHYYIHPDPTQCRSLTVREAARLQTFPDDYFFQGSRTAQFHQVGNAVPPYLAFQIAECISSMLENKTQ